MTWNKYQIAPWAYPLADKSAFKLPWSVAPLMGKYYGTRIINCDGELVMHYCQREDEDYGKPSERQLDGQPLGEWLEECCDWHWESERDLAGAEALCDNMNAELW